MNDDDGFIHEEPEGLSEEDEKILQGLKTKRGKDPITGRKVKKINVLNKKKLSQQEMDEFFTDL